MPNWIDSFHPEESYPNTGIPIPDGIQQFPGIIYVENIIELAELDGVLCLPDSLRTLFVSASVEELGFIDFPTERFVHLQPEPLLPRFALRLPARVKIIEPFSWCRVPTLDVLLGISQFRFPLFSLLNNANPVCRNRYFCLRLPSQEVRLTFVPQKETRIVTHLPLTLNLDFWECVIEIQNTASQSPKNTHGNWRRFGLCSCTMGIFGKINICSPPPPRLLWNI